MYVHIVTRANHYYAYIVCVCIRKYNYAIDLHVNNICHTFPKKLDAGQNVLMHALAIFLIYGQNGSKWPPRQM